MQKKDCGFIFIRPDQKGLQIKGMANNTNEYRFKNSTRNATTAMITQIVMGIISFVERMVFNQCFIPDYLGLYSLFKNVISVLSVAELGLSVAIAYSLYQPLAEDNLDEIRAIMNFYRRLYKAIGTLILIGGISVSFFLQYFAKTEIPMRNVQIYFFIYLLSTVFEYYFSYKQILFDADQKQYINTLVTNIVWALMYIIQIVISILTNNFMLYALCNLIFTLGRCLFINYLANNEYTFLKKRTKDQISSATKDKIKYNVKGLLLGKLGSVFSESSNSILISALVGSSILGLYSNYQMIYLGVRSFIRAIPNAITASLGNVSATEDSAKVIDSFWAIDISFFLIYGPLSIILINIVNPIIGTFFGQSRCLPLHSAIAIGLVSYLGCNRYLYNTYKASLGLYWFDRNRAIISGITNFILSFIFGCFWGFDGIMLGTIFSYTAIDLFIEPLIIFNRGFKASSKKYIAFNLIRLLIVIAVILITLIITSYLPEFGIVAIIIRTIVTLSITISIAFIFFHKNHHVKQSIKAIKRFILKKEY